MKKSIVLWGLIAGCLGMNAAVVVAGGEDGASVLKREAARARELQDLQYQAKLIEQRAKIAKSYQAYKESGGFIPSDMDVMGFNVGNNEKNLDTASSVINQRKNTKKEVKITLPILKRINGNQASFTTKSGDVEAKEGGFLPGGYRVLAVSSINGAKLEKDGIIYQVGLSWD